MFGFEPKMPMGNNWFKKVVIDIGKNPLLDHGLGLMSYVLKSPEGYR